MTKLKLPELTGTVEEFVEASRIAFKQVLDDDLNTPKALSVLHNVVNKISKRMHDKDLTPEEAEKVQLLVFEFDEVLGLGFREEAIRQEFTELCERLEEE